MEIEPGVKDLERWTKVMLTLNWKLQMIIVLICIYSHVDLRYFLARGGIEPCGRCFMQHHTSGAFRIPSPNRKELASTDLKPPPPDLSMSQLPCVITHAGLHRWSHLWPNSHESPRIGIAVYGIAVSVHQLFRKTLYGCMRQSLKINERAAVQCQ